MPKLAAARTGLVRKPAQKINLAVPIILALVVIAVAGALIIGGGEKPKTTANKASTSPCGNYRNDKRVLINGETINAEVATSQEQLKKGLGGRPCILPDQGMLLAFNKPGVIRIWMKDMKFPIDAIWIGADHQVVAEEIDLSPKTYPDTFVNKDRPAQFLLELKANRTKELKINIGTEISF